MRNTFLVITVKKWLKSVFSSFAEVIAKINQVSAFLDHPVYLQLLQGRLCFTAM